MVSLINFKIVNEDFERARTRDPQSAGNKLSSQANDATKLQQQQATRAKPEARTKSASVFARKPQDEPLELAPKASQLDSDADQLADSCNFVVSWRNLKFAIEPKWHHRVLSSSVLQAFKPRKTSGRPSQGVQTASSQQKVAHAKIVLDRLDGCFRSGELTAILGPSGKCERLRVIFWAARPDLGSGQARGLDSRA